MGGNCVKHTSDRRGRSGASAQNFGVRGIWPRAWLVSRPSMGRSNAPIPLCTEPFNKCRLARGIFRTTARSSCQTQFEVLVRRSRVGIGSQSLAKPHIGTPLRPIEFRHVNEMRSSPGATENMMIGDALCACIIVAEGGQRCAHGQAIVNSRHPDGDVDNRLRSETRYRRAADMFDAECRRSQHGIQSGHLFLEGARP